MPESERLIWFKNQILDLTLEFTRKSAALHKEAKKSLSSEEYSTLARLVTSELLAGMLTSMFVKGEQP